MFAALTGRSPPQPPNLPTGLTQQTNTDSKTGKYALALLGTCVVAFTGWKIKNSSSGKEGKDVEALKQQMELRPRRRQKELAEEIDRLRNQGRESL